MRSTDFDLSRDLHLNPDTGIATFAQSRVVVLDVAALGLLRQDLLEKLGWEEARRIILRFGYQHGFSDFLQMKFAYEFESENELLASGPLIHTWEGIVKATPRDIRFDRSTGEFRFTGIWTSSYEAEQYLTFNHDAEQPVCWSLTGYASGWCTAFFGHPLLAIEPLCAGKGDDHCEWDIRPPEEWGRIGEPYVAALGDLLRGA
jgi:hypothetical protein